MSSTDYTSGYTPQDFTGVDTYSANGTFVHTGDVTSGGWHLQRSGTNIFYNGELLTYTYANGAGVWSHPHMGTSYSNGRVQLIYDPTNPNPALRFPEFDFLESDAFAVAGPNVTSITSNTIFVPSDTVSNTDFTLLKNGSAYANTNIAIGVSASNLNGNAGPQPPSDARGYAYALTYSGTAWYNTTIDSKTYDDFYYDNSWTSSASSYTGRSTNSNRILNVLGSIPSGTIMTWTGSTSLTKDTSASSDKEIRWYSSNGGASGTDRNSNYGMYVTGQGLNIVAIFYHYSQGFGLNITYSSPFTVGAQATMSYTAAGNTVYVQDWVYSAEPEGDGYVPPVSTTSNGGGKPDRYPLIMTNLFNRNRSLYSIGMTHKDTWDLFL